MQCHSETFVGIHQLSSEVMGTLYFIEDEARIGGKLLFIYSKSLLTNPNESHRNCERKPIDKKEMELSDSNWTTAASPN